ncbi:MFS transporter [Endozoicomonas sp.]|uniref:MFS transporter n=1 Tax=Endozoicomonas sp. TaxID=1892382 RepID=UPI003AF4F733
MVTGGLLFGHLGDRYGRKKTFAATVLIMALSTALIGCLPTYHQIGIWAPILITILRLIQGFSIGGEIPGAITYLSESTGKHQGLVISLLFTALVNGFVLGSMVHSFLIEWLGTDTMEEWGWRLPFWFGGILGLFSYLVRKHFHESPLFAELNQSRQRQQIPVLILLKSYKTSIMTGILLIVPVAVGMSLLYLFTQSYLTRLLNYEPEEVSNASSLGIIASTLLFILIGWLADRHNSSKYKLALMAAGSFTVICCSLPIFSAYVDFHASVFWVMLLCAVPMGTVTGIAPLLLSKVFPTSIRYSGVAFSYNACFAIFGGLTPLIAMALINTTGTLSAPGYYLALSGFCGLAACYLFQATQPANAIQTE